MIPHSALFQVGVHPFVPCSERGASEYHLSWRFHRALIPHLLSGRVDKRFTIESVEGMAAREPRPEVAQLPAWSATMQLQGHDDETPCLQWMEME